MKLSVIILNDENKLDDLLHHFKEKNLEDITVINSNSKVTGYNKNKPNRIYGSIRTFLDYYNDESRIILKLAKEEEITIIKEILTSIVDSKQYTFFTIAVDNIEGRI